MAMVVKNNMSAVRTLATLNGNNTSLQDSLSKVASGLKINTAKDDASGYAISERMRVQIRSLDQANQNSQNASSLMKNAEGAVERTVDILRTLKQKAIDAASDTNTDDDRATIQKELDQLIDQIDDNALITFNGKYLLEGSRAQSGSAVATHMTNDKLSVNTNINTALVNLQNRNGENLEINTGDRVTVSFIMGGKTYVSVLTSVENTTRLGDIYQMLNTATNGGKAAGGAFVDTLTQSTTNVTFTGSSFTLKADSTTLKVGSGGLIGNNVATKELSTYMTDGSGNIYEVLYHYDGTIKNTVGDGWTFDASTGALERVKSDAAETTTLKQEITYDAKFDSVVFNGHTYGISDISEGTTTKVELSFNNGDGNLKLTGSGTTKLSGLRVAHSATGLTASSAIANQTFSVTTNTATDKTFKFPSSASATYFVDNDENISTDNSIGTAASGKAVGTKDGENALTFHAAHTGLEGQISGLSISISDAEGNVKKATNTALDAFKTTIYAANTTADGSVSFQVGASANQAIKVGLMDMRSEALGLKGRDGTTIQITTRAAANAAVSAFDKALNKALDQQTTIGAISARLDYTASNLTTSSENVTAAESTIRDADMAKEMTNYTKNNVLLQAAQSMLAQANQNSSAVLSLLQ